MIRRTPSAGPTISFNAPPNWPVPPGFDPRRGHLYDPTWPPAPIDWEFWVKTPRPPGVMGFIRRYSWAPVILALVLLFVATMNILAAIHRSAQPDDHGTYGTVSGAAPHSQPERRDLPRGDRGEHCNREEDHTNLWSL
jgi:hypothetical protein